MHISVTEFRRHLFKYVDSAISGAEVTVVSKGRRVKLAPDDTPGSKLSRVTPLDLVEAQPSSDSSASLQEEMTRAWERDWSTL